MAHEHLSDDVLEKYALRMLADAELAACEEGLLLCEQCRQRLVEIEAFVARMRSALRKFEDQE